jgi:uncharacterized protein YcfL
MRALILVAGAALAVAACSSENAAENTMNVDENVAMEADMNATMDMNADANMAMDAANDANAAADAANTAADAAANNAM